MKAFTGVRVIRDVPTGDRRYDHLRLQMLAASIQSATMERASNFGFDGVTEDGSGDYCRQDLVWWKEK